MITRRDFLKLAALSTGAFAFRPYARFALPTFPEGERLGRIAVGKMDVFATPEGSGQPIGAVYEENLVVWGRQPVWSAVQPGSCVRHRFFLYSGALLVLFVWYFPYKIDFNIHQFDSLPIDTVEVLLGIWFILSLSRRLERISVLSSMFSYVGQAPLIILILQVPIQDYWGQKLPAVTNNLAFSYWLSFLVGVIGPILINALFIRPNTIVREWFGQTAPRETKESAVSVFE